MSVVNDLGGRDLRQQFQLFFWTCSACMQIRSGSGSPVILCAVLNTWHFYRNLSAVQRRVEVRSAVMQIHLMFSTCSTSNSAACAVLQDLLKSTITSLALLVLKSRLFAEHLRARRWIFSLQKVASFDRRHTTVESVNFTLVQQAQIEVQLCVNRVKSAELSTHLCRAPVFRTR